MTAIVVYRRKLKLPGFTFSDDFNRPNGPLADANWVSLLGAAQITDNHVAGSGVNTVTTVEVGSADAEASVDVVVNGFAGLVVRAVDWDNCHLIYKDNQNAQAIYQVRTGGTGSAVSYFPFTTGQLRVQSIGQDLLIYDGATLRLTTPIVHSGTRYGLYVHSGAVDNFAVQPVVG